MSDSTGIGDPAFVTIKEDEIMGKMKVTGIVLMLILTGLIPMIMQTGTVNAAEVSGNQSGTWNNAGSPYYVTGHVTVPAGQSLEIDTSGGPVEVIFNGSYYINVDGDLYVNGSSTNRATFTSNKTVPSSVDWEGIWVNSTGYSSINNASISYARYAVKIAGSSNNIIMNCNISSSGNYGVEIAGSSNNIIMNSNISSSQYGIYMSQKFGNYPSNNYIANNTLFNCGYGMFLYDSNRTTVVNTTAMNNSGGGFSLWVGHNNTVSNNTAYDNYYGMIFTSNTNNSIDNNTVHDNDWGIYLRSGSTNNSLADNTVYGNEIGIYLASSANNTLTDNNVSFNRNIGIYILTQSSDNIITNNDLSSNHIGIHLVYSSRILITGNTMVGNGVLIEKGNLEHWNTHTIDVSNTVNGKPLYYWKNQTGGTIPPGAGQVILANCSDVLVDAQVLNNATVGIAAGFSSNITMVNNTASFNTWSGIYAYFTQEITLLNTTMVMDSIFISGDLIEYWNTHTIDTTNKVNGYPVYYWKDKTTGTLPPGAGEIILANCTNVIVNRQYIGYGTVGILMGFSDANKIINNELDSNKMYGICLISSISNVIYFNKFINNSVQAFSIGVNSWDYGSDGGNYWSDFNEDSEGAYDEFSGNEQTASGSDGLVDLGFPEGGLNPYVYIGGGNKDSYPFRNIICFPIRINSNSEFDRGHGVRGGSGTISDPWIIENGHIDGSGYGYCIYIGNTTDHFVVRNYNLHHADDVGSIPFYPDTSLVLYNVENGRLENNTITDSEGGILIHQSTYVNVSKNTMVGSGIYVVGGNLEEWNSHSMDELNTVNTKPLYYRKNQTGGTIPPGAGQVILANCTNMIVEDQNVSDGSAGILLGFSSECVIEDNTVNSNHYVGIELYESTDNEIINNTIDGNSDGIKLAYNSDFNNVTWNNVSGNAQGIYLSSANNNNMTDNNASENDNGISLSLSKNNVLAHNRAISNNDCGLRLDFSSNFNMVVNNTALDNSYGIVLSSASNYNSISNNNVSENGNGIHLLSSWNNVIGNNTCMYNQFPGINLESSGANTIVNNTCILNDESGLHLIDSNDNTIINNNFSASISFHGIMMEHSAINLVDNNTCSNNLRQGIGLWFSSDNTIKDNVCQANGNSGIYLAQSTDNIIENNNCTDSVGSDGISVDSTSDNNIVANNTCIGNEFYGIRLWDSDMNTVSNNTCRENIQHGLFLRGSSNNIVDNNFCLDNIISGIFLYDFSYDNMISENTCFNNLHGIYLSDDTRNDLFQNNITFNRYGVFISISDFNILLENIICHNQYGVYIEQSTDNEILSCNISYGGHGVYLYNADSNYIYDCKMLTNLVGIKIESSSSNMLYMDTIGSSQGTGVPYYSYETGLDVYQDDIDIAGINYTGWDDQLANGNGTHPFFTRSIDVFDANFFEVHIWGHPNSPDLDLAIFLDGLGGNPVDGITQTGEIVDDCSDIDADEYLILPAPIDGTYLIRVFGYTVTGDPGQFDMEISVGMTSNVGILLVNSPSNDIIQCNVTDNTNGINLTGSIGNVIYHNRFINNENQSYDDSPQDSNSWDDGYPDGGNYWSDYPGMDIYNGEFQDIPGSDGIGDTPYDIGGGFGNQDHYPLYIDPYAPVSSVDAISPYWYGTQPLVLTASAVGIGTPVKNVTLWYRFSLGNVTWGVWTLYGTDDSAPWSWSFPFNEGDGFYEFTSTAIDEQNTHEARRDLGDTTCAYDTTPPMSNALPLPIYTTLSPFDVDFSGTDSGCGFYSASLYYRYNGGPWTLYTTLANPSGQWTSSPISFDNVTDDGIYDFYTLGTDNLGHVEAPPIGKDATTIVDRYGPLSYVTPLPATTPTPTFFVNYNATDNGSGIKNVELFYKFNGAPTWVSYGTFLSPPIIFTAGDGDGLYEFYCLATDNLNNIEAKAAIMEASTILDTGSPTALSIIIDGGATYTTDMSVNLALSATDGTEMSFSNDGIIWSTWEPYATTKNGWTLVAGDGVKIVYFKCRDDAGNEAITSDSIILDTINPVAVSIVIDNGAEYTISTSVSLSIYASDANGIYQMMLSNDGVFDTETWEAYATTKAWDLSNGDGIKTVYVLFRDDALLESDVAADTIILDTIDPTGSIMINNGEEYARSPISVLMLSAYDTNGITMMRISTDGTFDTEIWESFMTSKAWMLSSTDGLKEVFVQYMDGAGRVSGAYGSIITLDTTSPVTTASISGTEGNEGWFVGNVTISLTGSDATSGLDQTYYRVNSGAWIPGDSVVLSSDGIHMIEYYSVDNAGNSEVINSMMVSLDATPPTVFSTTPADGSTGVVSGRVIVIEFNESMNASSVEASISLSPVITVSSYTWNNDNTVLRMVLLEDFTENTTYTITIGTGAEDIAGNTIASDYNSYFTTWIEKAIDAPDTTPPVTTASISGTEGNEEWYIGDVAITLIGYDTASGLNQTYYRINSGAWIPDDLVTLSSDGIYIIEYYSVDNAGNSEVINSMMVSLDATAPAVFSTTPVDGSTGVVAGRVIMIEFNEPMNASSVEASISLSPVITVSSYTWNNDNTVLRMLLSADLTENTTYTITLGTGAEDVAGNTMASDYTGSFTTWIEAVIDPDAGDDTDDDTDDDELDTGDGDEPYNWWLIHLLFLIIILIVLLAGRRRKKEEEEELTPEVKTAAAAGTVKAVPPPPKSKDEPELEECPTCGYDMEKGEECPICAGEEGMDEGEDEDDNIPHSGELGWKYKEDGVVDDADEVYEIGSVMDE